MRSNHLVNTFVSFAFAAAFTFSVAPAMAQSIGEDGALRADQAVLFQQMFDNPDNVDLMYQYALLSVRLKDYEAAITTLERILIFNNNLPRVKLELGAAYYRIGSYPVAEAYFKQVQDDPGASPDLKQRAAQFTAEIARRTQKSYFVGSVGANAIFTTNANNGPDNLAIEIGGQEVNLTDPNAVSQTDVGAAIFANVSHFYDLGRPNDDLWRSDLGYYSARYADTSDGAVDVLLLRTGPRLALDDDRYGPKIRPYLEFDHVRYANDPLYTTFGAGVELTNTIDQSLSIFGDLRVGYRDDHAPTATVRSDGVNIRARGGATYFNDDATILRGFGLFEYEIADTASARNFELGLGGDATYYYDSGFGFADRRWAVKAEARAIYRKFDAIGLVGSDTSPREDLDLRFAIGNTAYLSDGFALTAKASYFLRESNSISFELDNFTLTAGVEYRF